MFSFLSLLPAAWGIIKPLFSTTKETLNIIDTATALIQKRTTPLIKYILIIAGTGLTMEQIDALTQVLTYFNWNLKTQILTVLFVLCFLKMFSDVLLSPFANLKIAFTELKKFFFGIIHFFLAIILFSFSKKVRKAFCFKMSKWWEYSVKTKELEAFKEAVKVKSIEEKIENTEKQLKIFIKENEPADPTI